MTFNLFKTIVYSANPYFSDRKTCTILGTYSANQNNVKIIKKACHN